MQEKIIMIYMNIRRWKGMMYKMKFAMDLVIYARYSSQRRNETSIEAQLEECHRYFKENDRTQGAHPSPGGDGSFNRTACGGN